MGGCTGNGVVDETDEGVVMYAAEGSESPESIYDLDGDGDVNYTDATIVHDASGQTLAAWETRYETVGDYTDGGIQIADSSVFTYPRVYRNVNVRCMRNFRLDM